MERHLLQVIYLEYTATVLQLVCTLYRTDIFTPATDSSQEPRIEELTVDEIMNGIPGTDYQVLYCTIF